jgi:esterase FrsA
VQLEALRIPVSYLASRRDEIISLAEVGRLRDHVHELGILENDDVHASPKYGTEARLWSVLSILRMRHDRSLWRIGVGGLWHVLRMRSRLSRRKR